MSVALHSPMFLSLAKKKKKKKCFWIFYGPLSSGLIPPTKSFPVHYMPEGRNYFVTNIYFGASYMLLSRILLFSSISFKALLNSITFVKSSLPYSQRIPPVLLLYLRHQMQMSYTTTPLRNILCR